MNIRDLLLERNTTHGLCLGSDGKKTRLYGIWARMKQRCRDRNCKDYERYGGRGIAVCSEWSSYKLFHEWSMANGYRDNLTIERIENEGCYSPKNCKWIPHKDQSRNKRNNRLIVFHGETRTLAEWSEMLGIDHSLLRYRIAKWGVEKAFTEPKRGAKCA